MSAEGGATPAAAGADRRRARAVQEAARLPGGVNPPSIVKVGWCVHPPPLEGAGWGVRPPPS